MLIPKIRRKTKRHSVTKCSVYYRFSYHSAANRYQTVSAIYIIELWLTYKSYIKLKQLSIKTTKN